MRPKSKVHDHFIQSIVNEKTIYTCTFCRLVYKFKNTTKFARHLTKCDKAPTDIKHLFKPEVASVIPLSSELHPQASTSTSTSSSVTGENTNEMIHQALAKAIYVSGAPLSLLEHPLWKDALHMLNSNYTPPSRKVFSTSLLDKEYAEMEKLIEKTVNQAGVLHLAIDGWSNVRNESILNVMLYAPKPYFYKFITTEDNSHTASYLFEQTSEILEKIGAEKFLAIVSDNAANMIKLGDSIQKQYTNITWIGCLAHTLHLWIGDIVKTSKVRNLFSNIVEIIKIIKNSHILNAKFTKIAEEKKINCSLQLPVKTRWGSYLFCLQSFLKSKTILQNIVINEECRALAKCRTTLLDETMWHELREMHDFLEPIVYWITKLEGDYCAVHLVHKAFRELSDLLTNPLTTTLLGDDIEDITRKFRDRKRSALKPVHFAAAILDPKNQGCNLTSEEHLQGCEFIINANVSNPINAQLVLQDLTNYKNRTELWEKEFVWEMANTVAPMVWWQSLYPKTKLGEIAMRILSIPATSSSVERSFSTFSNIHTAKRNRLTTRRAGKICYIAHNWKLINRPKSISTTETGTEATGISFESCSESEDYFSDTTPEWNLHEEERSITLEEIRPEYDSYEEERNIALEEIRMGINGEDPLGMDN